METNGDKLNIQSVDCILFVCLGDAKFFSSTTIKAPVTFQRETVALKYSS